MHVTFDIDGVLADFSKGFCGVLKDMYGLELDPRACKSWHWADWADGLTKEMEDAAWDAIFDEDKYRDFWAELSPLYTTEDLRRINELSRRGLLVSFLTNRAASGQHEDVLDVTRAWLLQHGFEAAQNVFLAGSGQKGRMGRSIGTHIALEDNGPNCLDYLTYGVGVAVLRRPYNEGFVEQIKTMGGFAVDELPDFLDLIEEAAGAERSWLSAAG